MSENMAIGIVTALAALLLVGRSLRVRRRAGEPLVGYAVIWLLVFGAAFAVTVLTAR